VAFEQGTLDDQEMRDICRHLDSCPQCEALVADIEASGDGIVANLRRFHDQEPWIDQDELARLEAKIKAIPSDAIDSGTRWSSSEIDSATTPREEALIRRSGKYQPLHLIGRGGMGVVFAALHTRLKKKVAIKLIQPDYAGDSRVRARFRREMEAIGKLEHSNIVAATDADEVEGHPLLVMQFVDGINLDALIRLCGPLPVAQACEIIRQAALGLQYIHEQKLVHRDLKPSNLMLSTEGVVKILDLGLALLYSDEHGSNELTRSHLPMGTEDYMAPEQWEDSHEVDIRADIYSLGCTFYKLLTGDPPFSGPEYKPLTKRKLAHLHLACPPIQSRRPDVPSGIGAVLDRMLAKESKDRYQIPKSVASALEAFAQGGDCRQLAATGMQRLVEESEGRNSSREASRETVGFKKSTPGNVHAGTGVNARLGRIFKRRWSLVAGFGVLMAVTAMAVFIGNLRAPPSQEPQTSVTDQAEGISPEKKVLVAGKPYPLLTQQQPKKLFWRNSKFDHELIPRPELGQMTLVAPDVTMISIGETDRAGYELKLGIKKLNWTEAPGLVGLFFGCHPAVVDGQPCQKFQVLEIGFYNKSELRMSRRWGTFKPNGTPLMPPQMRSTGAGSQVQQPALWEWGTLEIIVTKAPGLSSVIWNGAPIRDLVQQESNKLFTDADYIGEFGTWNQRSVSTYGRAEIMLYERPP
jgi:serine/threonine protein kinase